MMAVTFDAIEVDTCPACEGIWFDRGELDLLLARGGRTAADWAVLESRAGPLTCPHCRRRLQRGPIQGTAIEVDFCPHLHGLWLDRGELRAVIASRAAPEHLRALLEYCGGLLGGETEGDAS